MKCVSESNYALSSSQFQFQQHPNLSIHLTLTLARASSNPHTRVSEWMNLCAFLAVFTSNVLTFVFAFSCALLLPISLWKPIRIQNRQLTVTENVSSSKYCLKNNVKFFISTQSSFKLIYNHTYLKEKVSSSVFLDSSCRHPKKLQHCSQGHKQFLKKISLISGYLFEDQKMQLYGNL